MVGLRAKVLGQMGWTTSPYLRASALSCPSLAIYGPGSLGRFTRPFALPRPNALSPLPSLTPLWAHNTRRYKHPLLEHLALSGRGFRAPTSILSWPRFWTPLWGAAFALRPLRIARDLGWCDHDYPRWGGHNPSSRARRTGFSPRVGAPTVATLGDSGPSLCPSTMLQGQPAPTFVDNGGRHPKVPHSPPCWYQSTHPL